MSMNGTDLGLVLANAANPAGPTAAEISRWQTIATALISYIAANATVSSTILTATAASVQPGTGTAPVTGTATGSIS